MNVDHKEDAMWITVGISVAVVVTDCIVRYCEPLRTYFGIQPLAATVCKVRVRELQSTSQDLPSCSRRTKLTEWTRLRELAERISRAASNAGKMTIQAKGSRDNFDAHLARRDVTVTLEVQQLTLYSHSTGYY